MDGFEVDDRVVVLIRSCKDGVGETGKEEERDRINSENIVERNRKT